jgi:NTP pyrophosphatase (non-canonical NTP hydrolase)
MIYKLKVHHKKGRWENTPLDAALDRLEDEVTELRHAVRSGNVVEINLEAADVANFALIASSIATERGK